jgi:hypothetical protein
MRQEEPDNAAAARGKMAQACGNNQCSASAVLQNQHQRERVTGNNVKTNQIQITQNA